MAQGFAKVKVDPIGNSQSQLFQQHWQFVDRLQSKLVSLGHDKSNGVVDGIISAVDELGFCRRVGSGSRATFRYCSHDYDLWVRLCHTNE